MQRTLAVGLSPQTLAVEVGSGRVVMVDSGGAVYVKTDGAERWLRQVLGWLPWLQRMALPPPAVAQVPGMVRMIEARA